MTGITAERYLMPTPTFDQPEQVGDLVREAATCTDEVRLVGLLTKIFRRTSYCRIPVTDDFLNLDRKVADFHGAMLYWDQWTHRCYRLYPSGVERDDCQLCNAPEPEYGSL